MFLFLISFPFGLCSAVNAEDTWRSPDPDTSLAHFPTKLIGDLPHFFVAGNLPIFLTGGALSTLDWATLDGQNSLALGLDRMNMEPVFDFGDFYGQGWVEGFSAVGSWGLGAVFQDKRMQEFGRDAAEALVDSTVLVTGLKFAVGRERPDGSNNFSFPSGHSITAFCVCPVVTKYFGWGAGIPAYALATITGFSRVEDYRHYLSDVLAGATLGVIVGNAVVYRPKDVTVSIGPGRAELKLAFN